MSAPTALDDAVLCFFDTDNGKFTKRAYEATADLARLRADLDAKQTLLDEAIRKGLQLCQQNGELLMQLASAQKRVEEARKIMQFAFKKLANIHINVSEVHGVGYAIAEITAWLAEEEK